MFFFSCCNSGKINNSKIRASICITNFQNAQKFTKKISGSALTHHSFHSQSNRHWMAWTIYLFDSLQLRPQVKDQTDRVNDKTGYRTIFTSTFLSIVKPLPGKLTNTTIVSSVYAVDGTQWHSGVVDSAHFVAELDFPVDVAQRWNQIVTTATTVGLATATLCVLIGCHHPSRASHTGPKLQRRDWPIDVRPYGEQPRMGGDPIYFDLIKRAWLRKTIHGFLYIWLVAFFFFIYFCSAICALHFYLPPFHFIFNFVFLFFLRCFLYKYRNVQTYGCTVCLHLPRPGGVVCLCCAVHLRQVDFNISCFCYWWTILTFMGAADRRPTARSPCWAAICSSAMLLPSFVFPSLIHTEQV